MLLKMGIKGKKQALNGSKENAINDKTLRSIFDRQPST